MNENQTNSRYQQVAGSHCKNAWQQNWRKTYIGPIVILLLDYVNEYL